MRSDIGKAGQQTEVLLQAVRRHHRAKKAPPEGLSKPRQGQCAVRCKGMAHQAKGREGAFKALSTAKSKPTQREPGTGKHLLGLSRKKTKKYGCTRRCGVLTGTWLNLSKCPLNRLALEVPLSVQYDPCDALEHVYQHQARQVAYLTLPSASVHPPFLQSKT